MGKFLKFLSDWVWQLPQNVCGVVYRLFIKGKITEKVNDQDCLVYKKTSLGGVTLGKYIFIWKGDRNFDLTLRHEKGHWKQSKILGWLYLLVIGLPSILHAWLNGWIGCCKKSPKGYYHFYTEWLFFDE